MPPETAPSRCWTAIYTRQSRTSSGDFSSCEAQLSACLSFVMARLGDGWVWNGKRYDDEGQSGETLDRPGLRVAGIVPYGYTATATLPSNPGIRRQFPYATADEMEQHLRHRIELSRQ